MAEETMLLQMLELHTQENWEHVVTWVEGAVPVDMANTLPYLLVQQV